MEKPILYATPLCPDCKMIKEYLDSKKFDYIYVDITSDIMKLKEFLSIRDSRQEFDIIKENHFVGVPALFINDKIYFYEDIYKII